MSTMEFKGAAWVGNVYQKFEAMCLEVEETMYEDTIKFVENQVQNVGSTMKKFYSDVMQDLVPPSSLDPVKLTAADLPLDPYADTGTHKKQKAIIKEDPKKADKIFTKDYKFIDGLDGDQVSPLDGLDNVNRTVKSSSGEDSCHKSKNTSSENHVLESQNRNRASSFSEINQDYAANDQLVMMTSPQASVDVVGCNNFREEEKEGKSRDDINSGDLMIDDGLVDDPIADVILLPKSNGKKGKKMRCTGEAMATNSIETCSLIEPYITGATPNNQSHGEEVFLSGSGRSGNCDSDVIDSTYMMKTIKQHDKAKFKEACVLVDRKSLSFVSLEEGSHRSYKKKMREAFSMKKKSSRRKEYEQLVMTQYKDTAATSSLTNVDSILCTPSPDSKAAKLQNHEFCESEWELL